MFKVFNDFKKGLSFLVNNKICNFFLKVFKGFRFLFLQNGGKGFFLELLCVQEELSCFYFVYCISYNKGQLEFYFLICLQCNVYFLEERVEKG